MEYALMSSLPTGSSWAPAQFNAGYSPKPTSLKPHLLDPDQIRIQLVWIFRILLLGSDPAVIKEFWSNPDRDSTLREGPRGLSRRSSEALTK